MQVLEEDVVIFSGSALSEPRWNLDQPHLTVLDDFVGEVLPKVNVCLACSSPPMTLFSHLMHVHAAARCCPRVQGWASTARN